MVIAIFAGGSGTRLWPLSTPEYPKHLLSLTNNRTLVQNTADRLRPLADDIYFISEASHADQLKEQLPEYAETIIAEPARRGTASCALYALDVIKQKHGEDTPVMFVHADHYFADEASLYEGIQTVTKAAVDNNKIAMLTEDPRYPSTGFGYVEQVDPVEGSPEVFTARFVEKPDAATAKRFIATGRYGWNLGYFVATIKTFETNFKKYAPNFFDHYLGLGELDSIEEKNAAYLNFPDMAIEYALMEKSDEIIVHKGSYGWADIGSFYDLHQISERDLDDNHVAGDAQLVDTHNSHIRNEGEKPVMVIGMTDVVVVNTPEGVLVCRHEDAQHVGSSIKDYWKKNPKKEAEKTTAKK